MNEAWSVWVDYCRKVKAWYAEGQKEPWGMNPPTEQIVDATLSAAAVIARAGDIEGLAKVLYYLDAPKAPQGTWEKFTIRLKQPYLEMAAAVSRFILEGK